MRHLAWLAMFAIAPLAAALLVAAPRSYAGDTPAAGQPAASQAATIQRLVEDLGNDDFRTRENASKRLAAFGPQARPALEKAARESSSPEVRWRAEQLLRRLEGSDQEKPLGVPDSPSGPARPGAAPKAGPTPAPGVTDPFERMRRLFAKLNQGSGMGGIGDLFGMGRVEAPGLALERQLDGQVRLRVQRKRDDGSEYEEVFTGHSLKDILARNPSLATHPGMAELKRRVAERSWPGLDVFREQLKKFGAGAPNGSGFSFSTSQGVEVTQDANGATVKIHGRDKDGKETVKTYKGKSLDEIKKAHPELADKIGGLSLHLQPPEIFWPGSRARPLEPLQPPTTPRAATPRGQAHFGLVLASVPEALASQLELPAGRGALVANVLPGSQAEAFGLQRFDVIVKVNDQDVTHDEAVAQLRKIGAQNAPVKLDLIRHGRPVQLSR
jgi:hypothetical protein